MTLVVFDTNVVSELTKTPANRRVLQFIDDHTDAYLSVMTIHELVYGAELLPPGRKRTALFSWIASIREQFAGQIIKVGDDIAEISARLRALVDLQGNELDIGDSLIAATAISLGATIATRNVKDFAQLDVSVINPWTL